MRWGKSVRLAGCALAAMAAAGSAQATLIFNPVEAKIQPGARAGVSWFAQAPTTGFPGRLAAISALRPMNDGSGRMFVNDLQGVVSVTTGAGGATRPWFDMRGRADFAAINTQAGLLSTAFHPNFAGDPDKPGYGVFYTMFTTETSAGTASLKGNGPVSHHDVLREWRVADPAAPTADIVDSREVMRIAQPRGDHGPGTIAFNTSVGADSADYGKLYIGLGDGGGTYDPDDNAQDLKSPFGKILRIDPADPDGPGGRSYAIPSDNPFAKDGAALGEVWASGLRNPQQFGWDDVTGAMYIADIGQGMLEEVNLGRPGANYGWPLREGTFGGSPDRAWVVLTDTPTPPGFDDPVAQYDHGEGLAISGAIRYRGSLLPELYGKMLVSELVAGRLFYFTLGDTSGERGMPILSELLLDMDGMAVTLPGLEGPDRADLRMGVDTAGEVYLLTKRDGDIYRLIASTMVPEPASWALMIGGFALVGGLARRRRDRVRGRHFASVRRPGSLYPRDGRTL